VPYWWNRRYESLAATVYSLRPELFSSQPSGVPIPLSEPSTTSFKSQSDCTHLFTLLLTDLVEAKDSMITATLWDEPTMNPTGWWMTEKYDGVRLYWNGSQFYSRQNRKVKAPLSLTATLPQIPLDGELWFVLAFAMFSLLQDSVRIVSRSCFYVQTKG
jgi:ATP-dependent DNA ligase